MHRPTISDAPILSAVSPRRPATFCLGLAVSVLTVLFPAAHAEPFAEDRRTILEALLAPAADDRTGTSKSLFGGTASDTDPVRVMREGRTKGMRVIGVVERRSDTPSVNLRVEFALDSAELDPDSRALLLELGAALTDPAMADAPVSVNGHTDSSGSDDHNLELSYARAESVRAFLTRDVGVDAARLSVLGFGESVPLNANATDAERAVNRRVEIERLQ